MRGNRQRRGFSLIELLIVITIIAIIATMALPRLMKAKMLANETAALGAIKTLHSAEWQYNSQFGRFAATLAELGPPASGADNPAGANLISSDLAGGEKQGYRFTVTGTPQGYTMTAAPTTTSNGSRTFYSDQGMDIHENYGQEAATASSPLVGRTAKASDSK
jgi:type IV pilus assembly protein PilA